MRVLTVRQPWAWAIIHGGKDVENRARNIAGTYRGPIAIHAGMREDTVARQHPEIQRLARDVWWTTPGDLLTGRRDQFGHIIGVVDIADVHRDNAEACNGRLHLGTCSPWSEPGAWHLCLSNARPIAEPIPFKGALGLRKLDDATIALVEDRLCNHDWQNRVGEYGPAGLGAECSKCRRPLRHDFDPRTDRGHPVGMKCRRCDATEWQYVDGVLCEIPEQTPIYQRRLNAGKWTS